MNEILSIGQRIGAYTVRGLIETGGGSPVWRVEDGRGAPWALKLDPQPPDADGMRRLQEHFELLRAIQHPNLVQLKELLPGVQTEGGSYAACVMEFIYGQDLQRYAESAAPLAAAECFAILQQTLAALERLHAGAQGGSYCLGGFTPRRVMRQDNGTIRLLTWSAPAGAGNATPAALIPGWHSPERLQGFAADAQADLYSAGALCHLLMTGKAPFAGQSIEAMIERRIEGPLDAAAFPRALSERAGFKELLAWIETALRWRADQRFGGALEMLRELRRIEGVLLPRPQQKKTGAQRAIPILLLGSSGAGKTGYLAALIQQLAAPQAGVRAAVFDPQRRAELEAQFAALRSGAGLPATAEELFAPVVIELRDHRRRLGCFELVDSSGRHFERLAQNAAGPLLDRLKPPCGLLLLLNPAQLNTAGAAAAEIGRTQSALEACREHLLHLHAAHKGGVLHTPLAVVLLEFPGAETAASADAAAHAEHLARALRKKFRNAGFYAVRADKPETLVEPLTALARQLRPGLVKRALPKILILAALALLALGAIGVARWHAQYKLIARAEAEFASGQYPRERLQKVYQYLELYGPQLSAGQSRQILQMIITHFNSEHWREEFQLQQLEQQFKDQPAVNYPASEYFIAFGPYREKWRFLGDGEWQRPLLEKIPHAQRESAENLAQPLKDSYQRHILADEAFQLEYLKQAGQPAYGVITAPAAIQLFRERHPWSRVRQAILNDLEAVGAGWSAARRSLDAIAAHLQPYQSAGIAPVAEAAEWLRGFERIAGSREQLETEDRNRNYRECAALLEQLQAATATLPHPAARQVAALRRAYQDWLELDWERRDLSPPEARRALLQSLNGWIGRHREAQAELARFLQSAAAGAAGGFLFEDARNCARFLEETLRGEKSDLAALRFRIDEWRLTQNPLAWKILFDLAWAARIDSLAKRLRALLPELNRGYAVYQENPEKYAAVPELYFGLGASCRELLRWRDEAERELDEKIDAVFNQRMEQFCRNYMHQLATLEKLPVITGKFEANPPYEFRVAAALTHQREPLDLSADNARFGRQAVEFVTPAAPADWSNPLRFELLMEVDDWGPNSFYRAELTFDFPCPLALLFLDQCPYRLNFTFGEAKETGTVTFGENFSLPWLLDPGRELPRK